MHRQTRNRPVAAAATTASFEKREIETRETTSTNRRTRAVDKIANRSPSHNFSYWRPAFTLGGLSHPIQPLKVSLRGKRLLRLVPLHLHCGPLPVWASSQGSHARAATVSKRPAGFEVADTGFLRQRRRSLEQIRATLDALNGCGILDSISSGPCMLARVTTTRQGPACEPKPGRGHRSHQRWETRKFDKIFGVAASQNPEGRLSLISSAIFGPRSGLDRGDITTHSYPTGTVSGRLVGALWRVAWTGVGPTC